MDTVSVPTKNTGLDPERTAESVLKAWERFILEVDSHPPGNANNVYASSYSECARQMALNLVAGDRVQQWSPNTLANFRRGKDRERALKADLVQIGRYADPPFEVVGMEERFELKDRKGRVVITGKVDLRIKVSGQRGSMGIPTEVKSWNTNTVQSVGCFEDLLNNPFTERGAYQLLSYIYASNEPFGFILLDRHGLPFLIPVVLNDANLDRMEQFLQNSERAMDAAELVKAAGGFQDNMEISELLPPFIDDPGYCKRCRFFGVACNPPTSFPGANIVTDETVFQAIKTAYETKPAAKEYADAWEIVKESLRGKALSVAPGFVITGKYQKQSKLNFPSPEEKALFEATAKRYTVTDPKGKFLLTVERVG